MNFMPKHKNVQIHKQSHNLLLDQITQEKFKSLFGWEFLSVILAYCAVSVHPQKEHYCWPISNKSLLSSTQNPQMTIEKKKTTLTRDH